MKTTILTIILFVASLVNANPLIGTWEIQDGAKTIVEFVDDVHVIERSVYNESNRFGRMHHYIIEGDSAYIVDDRYENTKITDITDSTFTLHNLAENSVFDTTFVEPDTYKAVRIR